MSLTLQAIAEAIQADIEGDGQYVLSGLSSIALATPEDVTFLSSSKYADQLENCKAGAVILKKGSDVRYDGNCLYADDPYMAFAILSRLFDPRPKRMAGIHPSATVSPSARIADSASIGANCVIGDHVVVGENTEVYPNVVISENSQVGDDCLIYANVSIYSQVTIGDRCLIHSGTVIGSDGFGFAPSAKGWTKIHQLGGVKIGNDVEIGASTAIDRGALEDTIIEDGVIIDNQVHIAHNVKIGEGSAIAGCVGIAGSATLGKRCIVAGAVAINGHIEVADGTQFNGGTIVTKGTKEGGVYSSTPPMQEVRAWRRNSVRYTQLDEMASRLKKLEKKLLSE